MGVSPMQAPDTPTNVTIHFEKGVPTMVDGVAMNCTEVIKKLNEVGGCERLRNSGPRGKPSGRHEIPRCV